MDASNTTNKQTISKIVALAGGRTVLNERLKKLGYRVGTSPLASGWICHGVINSKYKYGLFRLLTDRRIGGILTPSEAKELLHDNLFGGVNTYKPRTRKKCPNGHLNDFYALKSGSEGVAFLINKEVDALKQELPDEPSVKALRHISGSLTRVWQTRGYVPDKYLQLMLRIGYELWRNKAPEQENKDTPQKTLTAEDLV